MSEPAGQTVTEPQIDTDFQFASGSPQQGNSVVSSTTTPPETDPKEAAKSKAPIMEELQKAAGAPGVVGSEPIPAKSLVIKTKKPRPYACPTCTRSFARLEHLKRHERSHTKEKPFQCPICERSFARRDLLLRHKQKLHASFSPGDEKSHNSQKSSTPADASRRQSQQQQHQQQQQQHPQLTHQPQSQPGQRQYRSSQPQVGGQQQHGILRGTPGSSFSTPSPLGSQMATSQQYQQGANDLESMDLLTPLRSVSPQSVNSSAFPAYSADIHGGFSQQLSYPMNGNDLNGMPNDGVMPNGADHAQQAPRPTGIPSALFNEWKQMNPLAHELEMLQYVAPPFRVASRASRASSFSAASATSYVRQKDIEAVAPTSAQFSQDASEVGFATPQAYAVDDQSYDFEPLDLNFVSPAQLSQPPPRKRRVSVSASAANSSASPLETSFSATANSSTGTLPLNHSSSSPQPGPAMLALRAQVRSQRQLYHQFGVGNNTTGSSTSVNSSESIDPNTSMVKSQDGSPPQLIHNMGPFSHQLQQQPQSQQHTSHISPHQQQHLENLFSNDSGSFGDTYTPSPRIGMGLTPGMTPGVTPGLTPGMQQAPLPYQSSMSPLPEESGEIKDFLARQNEDFVNSLFDAEGDPPVDASGVGAKQSMKAVNADPMAVSSANFAGSVNPPNTVANGVAGSHATENAGMQRYIDAFFNGFDSHLSFVHRASQTPYNISGISSAVESPAISPPSSSSSVGTHMEQTNDAKMALSQAQAAIGAQTVGERGDAQTYYWAARDQHPPTLGGIEGLQADLLIAILGLFFDEPSEHMAALDRLAAAATDSEVIVSPLANNKPVNGGSPFGTDGMSFSNSLEMGLDWTSDAERLWEQFIVNQSRVRSLHALHSICCWVRRPSQHLLRVLEECPCSPCDDDLWRAPTSDIWLRIVASKGLDAQSVVEFGGSTPNLFTQSLSKLRNGEVPAAPVPQFTLQSLLLSLEMSNRISESLRAWESLWAASPDASLDPSPLSGPIMSDCVGIVSLVAFSPLRMSNVLNGLWDHDFQKVSSEMTAAVKRQQHNLLSVASYAIDTLVWCEGHVTSYSIFFTTLLAVTECGLVLSESLRYINSKNTPLTPNEEQLIQRSRKLVSCVLKVPPSSDSNALPNGVLRAAVCLIRMSDWPLVGALSRTLLANTQ